MKRGGKRKGAGRKLKYDEDTVVRGFRIPESLNDEIDKQAEKQELSASALIVKILKKAFRLK